MLLFVILVSSIILAHDTSATIPCLSTVKSSFKIYTVAQAAKKTNCSLTKKLQNSLKKNGFTKVMCPFGILLVATTKYPDELLKYGANIVANLIDNDNNGKPDHLATKNVLAHQGKNGSGMALVCGVNQKEERKEENLPLEQTFSCQTWKAGKTKNEKLYKAIMFEEAFHLVNEAWASSFPEIFGYKNFVDSLICRETAMHQCTKPGWWHPENKCPKGAPFSPGSPASSPLKPGDGDCTSASCDCFEFYRQAATLYMGWDDLPFWYSDYMPSKKEAFMDMATDDFLEMMANPDYFQPQAPLSAVYTRKNIRGTKEESKGACRNNSKFRVNGKSCSWVSKKPKDRCLLSGAAKGCKESCDNCPCNKGGGKINGEEACEGHGYNKKECLTIGNECCHYQGGKCWSSIGQDICKGV